MSGEIVVKKQQKYKLQHYKIEQIFGWITEKRVGIPELQRPFVWKGKDIRDLIVSLYHGYPIGFLVTWAAADGGTELKSDSPAGAKKILIDGQQRVKALMTSILGHELLNEDYAKTTTKIAFNPMTEEFAVSPKKGKSWIQDISPIVLGNRAVERGIISQYMKDNPNVEQAQLDHPFDALRAIASKDIGCVELDADLDVKIIADIFVTVNNSGKKLTKADFVMAKIASYGDNNEGHELSQCIDLFCHLSKDPGYFDVVTNDTELTKTDYFKLILWLEHETDDLFNPGRSDILRVALGTGWERAKLGDLLNLLEGRNMDTKLLEDRLRHSNFKKLAEAVKTTVTEKNFKRFTNILYSAGFVIHDLFSGDFTVDATYILYLRLVKDGFHEAKIKRLVKKWYVMATLTQRYTASGESTLDGDIKNFNKKKIDQYTADIEKIELSDIFWEQALISKLDSSQTGSPYLAIFRAARVSNSDKVFLSRDLALGELVVHTKDIHHIYPRDYLKKNGKNDKKFFDQSANFSYLQEEVNRQIGNVPPKEYMGEVRKQCNGGPLKYGGIDKMPMLIKNLKENCIPESIFDGTVDNYDLFLKERRKLMAEKIKEYYFNL